MRYKKSVFRSLAMVTQLGLCVLTPTILGIAAGSFLDARFGTKVTLILLVMGVLGGGRGAYLMAKRIVEQEDREEKAERERQMREVLADAGNSADRPKRPSRVLTADVSKTGSTERKTYAGNSRTDAGNGGTETVNNVMVAGNSGTDAGNDVIDAGPGRLGTRQPGRTDSAADRATARTGPQTAPPGEDSA